MSGIEFVDANEWDVGRWRVRVSDAEDGGLVFDSRGGTVLAFVVPAEGDEAHAGMHRMIMHGESGEDGDVLIMDMVRLWSILGKVILDAVPEEAREEMEESLRAIVGRTKFKKVVLDHRDIEEGEDA